MTIQDFTVKLEVPEGYTIVDYRRVREGEEFLYPDGTKARASHNCGTLNYFIVRPKEIKLSDLKPGEKFTYDFGLIYTFVEIRHFDIDGYNIKIIFTGIDQYYNLCGWSKDRVVTKIDTSNE